MRPCRSIHFSIARRPIRPTMSCCNGTATREAATHTYESVKNYYGSILSTNQDLKTSACTSGERTTSAHQEGAVSRAFLVVLTKRYENTKTTGSWALGL